MRSSGSSGGCLPEARERELGSWCSRRSRSSRRNAQQLSQYLHLDYTTVRHHLGVLEKNRLVLTEGEKYGKLYFLSDVMEANWAKLEEIKVKTGKSARKVNNEKKE